MEELQALLSQNKAVKDEYLSQREIFKDAKAEQEKCMLKIEEVLNKSDDYSVMDLQVLLEAQYVHQSAYQALLNTYAIRWFLKEVDKLNRLPESKLKLIQQEMNLKILDFG